MITRIFYALRQGYSYYPKLKSLARDPSKQSKTLLTLDPSHLKAEGIKAIALDFDGVLASYGESIPNDAVKPWISRCLEVFGSDKVFILTNKPTRERQIYFQEIGVSCISADKKKPYPEGLLKILDKIKIAPHELLLLDDRLLTGILAAKIAGVRAIWITEPYININKRPLPELFFILLRQFERLWFT